MNILVLGAGGPAGINVTRAFYEAGHITVACDTDPVMLQMARGKHRELVAPDRPADQINALIEKYDVGFVHAQPDVEVQWLAANAHRLDAPTLLPHRAALYVAADKFRTALVAGPDAPRSLAIEEDTDLGEAIDELGGDCWMRLRSGAGSAGALPVKDESIAKAWIDHHRTLGIQPDEWMIAERLPGKDLSFTGVYREGRLLGFGMKERLRLHGASRSPARVASTANLQVTVDRSDLRSLAHRVIEAMPGEAEGIFMLDVREDRYGTPKLCEINAGRFGTTSLHWVHAGLNLPAVYVEAARREPMSGARVVPRGVAWCRELDSGSQVVTL